MGKFILLLAILISTTVFAQTQLVVLGTAQDAGLPHIACKKDCCKKAWSNPKMKKLVSALGVFDESTKQSWLFDATPDIAVQSHNLLKLAGNADDKLPSGIFLTHAHIGHYSGLMYLGREAAGGKEVPVYVMPKFRAFIEANGPWEQLVKLKNIQLYTMKENEPVTLTPSLKVSSMLVPHRDEYSETVGFVIEGSKKKALFIPDIDKWDRWNRNLAEEIAKVDYAFLDATFYKNGEIKGRQMSEIPHPFVEETMKLLEDLTPTEKAKVFFIHINHTNPLLNPKSKAYKEVKKAGYNIAEEGVVFDL